MIDDLLKRADTWLSGSGSFSVTTVLPVGLVRDLAARVRELEEHIRGCADDMRQDLESFRLMKERAERAEAELFFQTCVTRELLPYQERAVKAEVERDALRDIIRQRDFTYWMSYIATKAEAHAALGMPPPKDDAALKEKP